MIKKIFTIGFTKRTAENFFETLRANNIDLLLDIRVNNRSQLSGFTKYPDIEYFTRKCIQSDYIHELAFAPTKELLQDYKQNKATWNEYEIRFSKIMDQRDIEKVVEKYCSKNYERVCLLCSEFSPENCHRRLVAETFNKTCRVPIIHL